MKKTSSAKLGSTSPKNLLPEYQFDYSKAKPNRFAKRFKAGYRIVLLEPDVAEAFRTDKSVNKALRALLPAKAKGA